MNCLRIFLFDGMRVIPPGASSGLNITPVVQRLLAYLLLHRNGSLSRDKVAGVFWGDTDEDRARASLSTALC